MSKRLIKLETSEGYVLVDPESIVAIKTHKSLPNICEVKLGAHSIGVLHSAAEVLAMTDPRNVVDQKPGVPSPVVPNIQEKQ